TIEFTSTNSIVTATVREKEASQTRDVPHLLGLRPLQQPLVATDRGRLQALPVAYDPARREWFDVFSGEERRAGEFGHWTVTARRGPLPPPGGNDAECSHLT